MSELFTRVLERLAREPGARVLWASHGGAGLIVGSAAVLVFAAEGDALPELLPATVDATRAPEIDLVLVGGGPRALATLQAADLGKRMERQGVRAHVADDGAVWTEGGWFGRPWLKRALAEAARGEVGTSATASLARAAAGLDAHDLRAFIVRPTPVTRGLMTLCIAMFAVEALLGGSTWTPALVRLGAAVPGEPWRALSASTLHIGLPHLLVNLYALHVLGGSVERALGSARFLVVWVGSCLVGGVLGGLTAVSAGASTGLWGLMLAQAILIARKSPRYPAFVVRAGRRGVWSTVALNLLLSFLPGVSLFGHLGGGIGGAILVFFVERRWPWRPMAWAAGALLALSLLVNGVLGRAWELAGVSWRIDQVQGVEVELPTAVRGSAWDPIVIAPTSAPACEGCEEGAFRVWRGMTRAGNIEVRVERTAPGAWQAAAQRVWNGLQGR